MFGGGTESAKAVTPEQPIKIDAIETRSTRRRGHAAVVAAQDVVQIAELECAQPLIARRLEGLIRIDDRLTAVSRRLAGTAERRLFVQREASLDVIAKLAHIAR